MLSSFTQLKETVDEERHPLSSWRVDPISFWAQQHSHNTITRPTLFHIPRSGIFARLLRAKTYRTPLELCAIFPWRDPTHLTKYPRKVLLRLKPASDSDVQRPHTALLEHLLRTLNAVMKDELVRAMPSGLAKHLRKMSDAQLSRLRRGSMANGNYSQSRLSR